MLLIKRYLSKEVFILALIFLVAFVLRVYLLGDMPSGFHRDEVISGYVGRFILQHGKDPYGNIFPLFFFDKYGDFPPVIPMYFSGISTLILGPTVFATRFPIAVIGSLFIFPIYFLTEELFKRKSTALYASAVTAILPWHIILSRSTAEGILALFFASIGLIFMIKFIKRHTTWHIVLASLCLLLTYLLYPSFRILVPLMVFPLLFLVPVKKKAFYLVSGLVVISIVFTLWISSTVWGIGRLNQTAIYKGDNATNTEKRIEILANEEGTNKVSIVKLFHNKYVLYTQDIISQYLSYYSPQYLFLQGGLPYRYSVPDEGLLLLLFLPFLFLGLINCQTIEKSWRFYILYLLIIAVLPSPLTIDDVPNVHRSLFLIVPLVLLISYGIDVFFRWIPRKAKILSYLCVLIICAIQLIYFLHMYYSHSNAVKSIERGDSNKEAILDVAKNSYHAQMIYMPVHDAFPIYYLFFTNNFSASLIGNLHKMLVVDHVGTTFFTITNCPSTELKPSVLKEKILVLDHTECTSNPQMTTLKTYSRHDGTTSYRLLVTHL